MKPFKYLIQEKKDFDLLLEYLYEAPIFGYDTETNGKFSQFEVQLVGMSFGFSGPDFAVYLPLLHNTGKQLPINYVLDGLKDLFEDPVREYVAHNAKFDEMVLGVHGINCQGIAHDTLIMAWLLQTGKRESKGLKQQVKQRFGVIMDSYEDVVRGASKRGQKLDYNFARVTAEAALSYAADDAYYTLRLFELFSEMLKGQKLWGAYSNIERPLCRVVGQMERKGVVIDMKAIRHAAVKFPEIREEIYGQIYEHAEEVFNVQAPAQLGKVLLRMEIAKEEEIPKTDKGNLSWDKDTIKMLKGRHPIIDDVLRVRKINKTHGTFVEGLMEKIARDGRLHASFNPTGTETGRFSCNNPNLQQIEGDEVEGIKIRNFFVAPEGSVFVGGDYSQIELRILAHLSKDQNMIDAFLSGMDFHDATARKMLEMQGNGISLDTEVLPRQRFHAKSLNFGIPYGRGPGSVAGMLEVNDFCDWWNQPARDETGEIIRTVEGKIVWGYGHWGHSRARADAECHECGKCFIEDWFATFPLVRELKARTENRAIAQGFVRTLAGRKRILLPDIRSNNAVIQSGAKRQAFNTVIQGSAADIIKLAMVALAPKLKPFKAQIVLTIHDELIVESPESVAEDVREVMQTTMEKPLNGKNPLSLPLKTDPQIATTWGDAK